ncbi:heterokaryon incompatibility protein-domain-containing protein [Trametes gibbosa]|nr:heterokaryon incompatibility protein-domain-containing protein [Trametes gibbosa]
MAQASPSDLQPFTLENTLQACRGVVGSIAVDDKPLRVLRCNEDGAYDVVPYQGQPYLAISYCWPGSSDFHRLSTSSARTPVITPNGVVHSEHFSLFISHAAHTYDSTSCVWLDYHCINQSDDDEKSAQVAIMQRIYTGAKLTLVMLEDVSLRPEHRRILATPQATPTSLEVARHVLSSRWFSRAWCSQELVLSRHAHFYVHDASNEGDFISIPSDTLWHIFDGARNRDPSIPFFTQPRGSLPDVAMAKSTCAWALGVVHHLGCSDDYDKTSLLCNLLRLVYRFARRPTAFGEHSRTIQLNVLKMANVIAIKRHDFSLLLVNHGIHNHLQGRLGFGWAGAPIEGDRASLVWAKKDFQVAKDPQIMLTDVGLLARGCLACVTQEYTWQLHRDCTGLHLTIDGFTRAISSPSRAHASWTRNLDAQHLHDLFTALASCRGHGWDDATRHARVVFAYLLSVDYDVQPDPISSDLDAVARSFLREPFSLKDIASAMSFIWRASNFATFSTVHLSDGSVLLLSGNISDLTGRLLFQPYVVRPKLFSPPMVLTINSMVLENRVSPLGAYRCIGCVRGLGMISEADGHGAQSMCVA